MTEPQLTKFQQELMDKADEIATRRGAWLLADANNRNDLFARERLIEAQAAFRTLVLRAVDNTDDHGDWCMCPMSPDEHSAAYERYIDRNTHD
jgi:hypothetical protein